MKLNDQLKFVTSHMKKNKLRVSMTILAATIGCAFLIILASVGFGLHKTIQNSLFNQEDVTKISVFDENVSDKTMDVFNSTEHVNIALKTLSFTDSVHVEYKDRTVDVIPNAFKMSDKAKLPSDLSEGRLPENKNEIIVGYDFASSLMTKEENEKLEKEVENSDTEIDYSNYGVKESMLNKTITVNMPTSKDFSKTKQATFKIVGVSKDPAYKYATDNSISFDSSVLADYKNIEVSSTVYIYVDSLENVVSVSEKLSEDGYNVYSPLQGLESMNNLFLFFKIGLIFIGFIAVVISSIGIFNTMTMAVTERTREIGVLKAIGASPNLVQRLFLMESAFIGIIGTVLAVGISYLISFSLNALSPIILSLLSDGDDPSELDIILSYISPSLVIIASVISFGVAVLSGWRPARKATKTEVVQSLRQDS